VSPDPIPFAKAHALGNDFLLVEHAHLQGRDPEAFARCICDRHTGLGADGVVVLGSSPNAQASFRIYNADGSEAEISGNALRCAAAWLLSKTHSGQSTEEGNEAFNQAEGSRHSSVRLETRVGVLEVSSLGRSPTRPGEWIFQTQMGQPAFAASAVPFRPPARVGAIREPIIEFPLPVGDITVPVTLLSMGNPHCIAFVDDWAALDWLGLGAELEVHPFFPERTNVGFVRVTGEDRVEARFWERGVGHTLASGTGSCACAVAAHLAAKTGRRVVVACERGEMIVNWREDGTVELTGPAEIIAEGIYQPV
jgi:diaminopimelate epimerase